MATFNSVHGRKQPREFAAELVKFFAENKSTFIDTERNRQKFKMLMLNSGRNRNFRTLPCKAYHPPAEVERMA